MSAPALPAARAAALLALALALAPPARAEDDVPMRAMRDELQRSAGQLRLQQMDRPYFIAYRMDDIDRTTVSATLGSLASVRHVRVRALGVELRIGDYALDSSNYFSRSSLAGFGQPGAGGHGPAPLDDDYAQIRRQLWLATDARYKKALEDLSGKRAALRARKRTEELPDFTREPAVTLREPQPGAIGPRPDLEALVRDLSAVFRTAPEIQSSSVELETSGVYTRFVNTEGTSFTRSRPAVTLRIRASAQATSSMPIFDQLVIHARAPADLPPRDALLARVRELVRHVVALRSAPSIERYDGPVLFEGLAAAELFAQIFAPGLVAIRQPMSDDPRFDAASRQLLSRLGIASFQDRVGARILPEFLSVTDDPLRTEERGTRLLGGGPIDDEGVPTRETKLVEHGVLKSLLATRVPVRSARRSTGSRRGAGAAPSNLRVTSERSATPAQLRAELFRRARERGLEYGVVVRRVGGGSLGHAAVRLGLSADGAAALAEAVRVWPDGREELLQGVELGAVTAAAFKDVAMAGADPAILSLEFAAGMGGLLSSGTFADTGGFVFSCVVPALLFDDLSLAATVGPFPNPPLSPSPLASR